MKNILILSFLFFSSCGVQAPSGIPRLFPPGALKVTYSTAGTGTYTIMFEGLNPEDVFSGYNLYYTVNESSAVIGSGTKIVRTSIAATDPTFSISRPFFNVSNFTFELNINNAASNNIFHGLGATPATIWWFVRAYSRSENRESPYSLAVLTVVDP
ncbi:MAG: hypothetical protein ACRC9L_09670 [Brevinema sp.]